MLSRSFCKRSGKPTWYSPPESWWKCRTFCNGFATDPDCPEREVQSWTTPLRESRSTNKSRWAYRMGEHCCYCYKEVRCPKNMHRSTTVEPSLKKRNTSAANPRWLIPELARAKNFSTVDRTTGFWHCVLDDKSRLLTTFATPFGRHRWKRLPFGPSSSSEIFQKRGSQALEGLEGILNITDDILIYGVGDTEDEARRDHDLKLEALLLGCTECGITLNKNKLKLQITEVPFMGHLKSPSPVFTFLFHRLGRRCMAAPFTTKADHPL